MLYAVLSSTLKDMLKFQAADGPFMVMNSVFDADKDGKTSKTEYDADARKNRALGLQATAFETLDADHDGVFTQADFRTLRKPLVDAVEADNYDRISAWLKQTAVVDLPTDWLQDHFVHPSMWSLGIGSWFTRGTLPEGHQAIFEFIKAKTR